MTERQSLTVGQLVLVTYGDLSRELERLRGLEERVNLDESIDSGQRESTLLDLHAMTDTLEPLGSVVAELINVAARLERRLLSTS